MRAVGRGRGRVRNNRGAGRGGRGRGKVVNGDTATLSDPLSTLPEALKAFSNGWEEITTDEKYEVVMKEEYNKYENGIHICHIYKKMADKVVRAINRKGVPLNTFNPLIAGCCIVQDSGVH